MQYEKALESMKDGKVNVLCIIDKNHERSVVALDHFRNFKAILLIVEYIIENKEGILIYPAGKRELLFEIKKRKVKNWKNCLKLLGILDEQEPSVQSAEQVWDWEICIYQDMEKDHHSIDIWK